jgi:hypothetical protein
MVASGPEQGGRRFGKYTLSPPASNIDITSDREVR